MDKWKSLVDLEQLKEINSLSMQDDIDAVVIFKHSTRCSISSMANNRLNSGINIDYDRTPFYFLDLLAYRDVSQAIADEYNVQHESPQILIIKKGQVTFHTSHNGVNAKVIEENVN